MTVEEFLSALRAKEGWKLRRSGQIDHPDTGWVEMPVDNEVMFAWQNMPGHNAELRSRILDACGLVRA